MEIGMAAAVLPRLKILSLAIYNYESTTPESSFFYHLQSLKAQAIQNPALFQQREEGWKENISSKTQDLNLAVI